MSSSSSQGTGGANPCDPDPSVNLTVTGDSGTITWCGQTWNLPGDSGVQKAACPTSYILNATNIIESWKYSGTFPNVWQLTMKRSTPSVFLRVGYALNGTTLRSLGTSHQDTVGPGKTWDGTSYNPPTVTAATFPNPSDYRLNSKWFGSHKSLGGITFVWEQGSGW